MKAELRTITPEWARQVLADKNEGNRPINRRNVEKLMEEMKSGRWKVNGDTICINDDKLIDGQHRLSAVALSGITIQSFVIEGLPSDVFNTKDTGKIRTGGDTLSVLGQKNAYRLSATLTLVDKYMTGNADKYVEYTNTQIQELLFKYPDVKDSLQLTVDCKGFISPSLLDACHYIFSRKDKDLADEFVYKLTKGTGLQEGDPFYLLRERLLKNSLSKAKLTKIYTMALCIKAWNHTRMGMKIRSLRWRDNGHATEMFPVAK